MVFESRRGRARPDTAPWKETSLSLSAQRRAIPRPEPGERDPTAEMRSLDPP
jgi:hypothetical protein